MPIAAPLIGAAAGIGGSLIAGSAAKKANKQAIAAQEAANNAAIAEQRRQFDITQQNTMPWLQAGQSALTQQGNLVGLNGNDTQQAAIDQVMAGPLYQSMYRNGQNTILANASATGGLRGGNTQRSLADFGSDTLTQAILAQLSNLGGISGAGQAASNTLGQLGQNSANNISGILHNTGTAQGSGALLNGAITGGTTSGVLSGLGGLFGNSGVQSALGSLFKSGGSSSSAPPIVLGGAYGNFMSGLGGLGGVKF